MQTLRLSTGAAALAVSSLAMIGVAGPAGAQANPYPPGQGGTPPGQTAGFNCNNPGGQQSQGRRCRANTPNGTFDRRSRGEAGVESTYQKVADFTANGAGAASVEFTLPSLSAGQHDVVFRGVKNGAPAEFRIPFTVEGTAVMGRVNDRQTGGTPSSLPFTGSGDLVPLTAAGVGLVVVGAGVLVASRRRRSEMDTAGVA